MPRKLISRKILDDSDYSTYYENCCISNRKASSLYVSYV